MTIPLRALIVEDVDDDAQAVVRILKRAGYAVSHERVDSLEGMRDALDRQAWDIVISDFSMPGFGGLGALALLRARDPDLPFIVVSGTIGEETAVATMRAGASDYVMKRNLARLAPAVERELRDARTRHERRQTREALGESEAALHRAQSLAKLAHVITGADGDFESWSTTLPPLLGLDAAQIPKTSHDWLLMLHPDDRATLRASAIEAGHTGAHTEVEYRLQRGDRSWICIRHVMERLRDAGDGSGAARWFSTIQDVTVQREAEVALRDSELRFRQLAESIQDVFFIVDVSRSHIFYVSPAYEKIWGRTCESLYADFGSWADSIHPEDREDTSRRRSASLHGTFDFDYRIVRPDGIVRWIRVRGFPILDDHGEHYRTAVVASDITEQKDADTRIRRLNRVYAVLSGINALIVRVRDRDELFREVCRIAIDDGGFRLCWIGLVDRVAMNIVPVASAGADDGFLDLVRGRLSIADGSRAGHGLTAMAVREKRAIVANDVTTDQRIRYKEAHAKRGLRSFLSLPLTIGDEVVAIFDLHASEAGYFDDAEMKLLGELARNISLALDHIAKSAQVDYLAHYDVVTGLANRALFHARLERDLKAASREPISVGVVIWNVERFRTINETLGRQGGDELLKQIAARMLSRTSDPSRLARIGVDHFAVVVPDPKQPEEMRRRLEMRMHEFFDSPFRVGKTELRISVTAGVAMYPDNGPDADTLLLNAEAALKSSKALGERFVFYTDEMSERVAGKLALENELRQGLENEEFVLHYQPKIDMERRRIVGVEALIRWQSPARGLVPPLAFIPLLEETGLILAVGAWALRQAARDHRRWVEQKLDAPRVAVNVSQVQLRQRDFVAMVERAIMDGVSPTAIDLEITESLVMEDVEANIEKLDALKGLGVRIAIDDFGTGYSSLGYLAKLPVQSLKIDRAFISAMEADADAMTLVSTIISLAHSLRLSVIAEGVETEAQAKSLRLLKCDEMQGYLFSKPLPLVAMTALLRTSGSAGESEQPRHGEADEVPAEHL